MNKRVNKSLVASVARSRRGATMVEYALLVLALVVLIAAGAKKLGYKVGGTMADAKGSLGGT